MDETDTTEFDGYDTEADGFDADSGDDGDDWF